MGRIDNLDLEGLRQTCWAITDHAPSNSAEAKNRFRQFANLAQNELAKDAPFLADETIWRTSVQPDLSPASTADRLDATADPYVLTRSVASGAGYTTWQDDGLWAGRQIHLKDPAAGGMWHLYTIREAWTGGSGEGNLTLDRPWPNSGDTGIEWRIYQHPLKLPSNVIEVKSVQLLRDQIDYPVDFMAQGLAEYASLAHPNRLLPVGPPRKAFRRPMQRLQAPAWTPGVSTTDNGSWDTASSPVGKFEYCFTYSVGQLDEWNSGPGPTGQDSYFPYAGATGASGDRQYEPLLESPPSDISAPITVASAQVILVTLPDIDSMSGFGDAGTLRYNRSGIKKRIYRRRLTDGSATPTWEARERWYLLDEVDGDVIQYTDDGSAIPDMRRPLLDNHGTQLVEMYPTPDQRYDVQVRAVVAPPDFEVDSDCPSWPEWALPALIARIVAYLYESMGNMTAKGDAMRDYELHLRQLRKRAGNLNPSSRPRQRRTARVRRTRKTWRQYLTPEDEIV